MVAMKSKDPSTKVGTVIVDSDNIMLATGYNDFPRGFDDFNASRKVKSEKSKYTVHSEMNACLSAARKGHSLHGGTCYVTWAPCHLCSLALVQSGVKEVIFHSDNQVSPSWVDSIALGKANLLEGGVKYTPWSGDILLPKMFVRGEVLQISKNEDLR